MALRVVERMRGSNRVQALPAGSRWNRALPGGNADQSFPEIPENRRNQPLQFMAADFVFCPAAATGCRLSLPAAGGTGHCPVGVWGSAKRSGASPSQTASAMPTRVFRKFRKTEEISRSNLWRLISCSVRRQQPGAGSACRQQVAPGTARWGSGGARSEAEPPPARPRRQCRQKIRRKFLRIRRPWPLQFMAANGRQ